MRTEKVKPVKKLSAKVLCPNMKTIIRGMMKEEEPSEEPIFIGRVMGVVRKADIQTNDYGDSWKFTGDFQGFDASGVRYVSGICYLPDVIADPLANGLGEVDGTVEFGCDLFIRYDETSTTNYIYEVEMLTAVGKSDPLAALEASMPSLPQLAAPELPKTDAKAEEKAPESKPKTSKK